MGHAALGGCWSTCEIALSEVVRLPAEPLKPLLTDMLLICSGCHLFQGCTKGLVWALQQHGHTLKTPVALMCLGI